MHLENFLQIDDVQLALGASDRSSGIDEVLAKLNGDARVTDWESLRKTVLSHEAAVLESSGIGICIAHGRSQGLKSLVVAAGRSDRGLAAPEGGPMTRLIFVAGIPSAMNAQYLGVVGAIARVCSNKRELDKLLTAKSPEAFIETLQSACTNSG